MRLPLFLLGFIVAVAFWPGALDGATAPRWAALAVGAPLALLLSDKRVHAESLGLLALLLLPAALALAWTSAPLTGLEELGHLLVLAGVFALGAALTDAKPAWLGLASGVALSAGLALAQSGFQWSGVEQAAAPAGLFLNKNLLAEAAAVALIASAFYGWRALAAAALLALALAGSRGALVALLVVGFVALWRLRPALAQFLSVFLAPAACALALFAWHGDASVTERLVTWRAALSDLTPLGHGLGSFAGAFPVMEFAHSEPVQAAYELGWLALPPLAALGYVLYRGRTDGPETLILAGVLALGLFSFPLRMPVTGFALALAAGALAGGGMRLRDAAARLSVDNRPDDLRPAHGAAGGERAGRFPRGVPGFAPRAAAAGGGGGGRA